MSTSSEIVDSNFSHTFNLFTQYLKKKKQENAHLPLGMTSSTMNVSPKKVEPESTQMTIFYGGQVMVVDDYKAMEIFMMLGGSGSGSEKGTSNRACDWIPKTKPSDLVASTNMIKMENQGVRLPGLPIARKASLARFLEKRKERITARAPYQGEKASSLGSTRESS